MRVREAVDRYLSDVQLGRSADTHLARRSAIARWLLFLELRGQVPGTPFPADLAELAEDHLMEWARWVAAARPARDTSDLLVAGVVGFYAYLGRERLRPDLPLEALRLRLAALRGRRGRRLPRVPSDDVVDRLLAAARAHRPAGHGARAELMRLRNVALVETMRSAGLRVSEVCGLPRGALRADGSIVVVGKGGKARMTVLSTAAQDAIAAYLAARADDGPARDLPVFARHDARAPHPCAPMDTDSVRGVVRRLAEAAGVADAGVTPHRLRAWFATRVGAATGDLAATQELLGHANPATTRVYLQVSDQHLVAVHGRAFPRDHDPPSPSA